METKKAAVCRSKVVTRNGEIQIAVFEDGKGEPYLVIRRIIRTKSGRIRKQESVPVFGPELAAFYNRLLQMAPQLGLKAF
ncbi:MAG TPA: hypothetical protein ENF38_00085 [Candidatus Aenigmarchaeota archaeon]|nr:hypothetical protein [Candidatus Aenigmarchaeota archaeon]